MGTPTPTPGADCNSPQERQGRTTTKAKKDCHTRQGKLTGPPRDPLAHTRELHTPAAETRADRRASGETQRGSRAARPDQARRGTEEAPIHMHNPQTRPRRGRVCYNPYPDTNRNPQPRGQKQSYAPTLIPNTNPAARSQICAQHTPTKNTRETGATHTNPHKPQARAWNRRGQAETQTRAPTKPESQTRRSQGRTGLKPKRARHTTVGIPVSIARTLRQPVPCR